MKAIDRALNSHILGDFILVSEAGESGLVTVSAYPAMHAFNPWSF